ncbi:MAG: hypothetical protein DI551_07215 [Micavibrio aeruginosavorus]|uniref:Uncharacterized protein n=1 Tax=Micavibrio aeruginosavorus TaxID=349221 RepID=A0A2W5Q2D7_9BACT|nr:MAG: hypothetical protein DI551_07215 [Micavibrio aeruginosavorus]
MSKALVILRHENSLKIVAAYLQEKGIESVLVALDPVDLPDQTQTALTQIKDVLQDGVCIIVLGTKVYDTVKREKTDPPEKLIDFLEFLKNNGGADIPICLTHLSTMPDALIEEIKQTRLCATWVENDNLKNDGMNNLGPLILKALDQ